MHFRQFYLACLAHASYLIGSNGEAVVVDPQRDVDQYIAAAAAEGLKIRYILETHLHADFVSGHRELAARTGAQIVFSSEAHAQIEHLAVSDGDELRLGAITLRALATPGHTPESMCWLVIDESGKPTKILTGDTLFIGDVGRPDLAGGRGFTPEMMAGMLYDSLHSKILTLPDELEVFPAHGAGSACGRNISKETSSTLGLQRRTNYALQPMSRADFIALMTTGLEDAPRYFPRDAELNRSGARTVSELPVRARSVVETTQLIADGALVLDVRDEATFASSHLPSSINIGLGGQFASWCGTLLSHETPILLVAADDAQAHEAVLRLARVGMENAAGYLAGGIDAWVDAGKPVESLRRVSVQDLATSAASLQIIDVRRESEFALGHVPHATNIPLHVLQDRVDAIRPVATAVICAGGYRSSAAASLLLRAGVTDLANVTGGTAAWIREGLPTEQ